jgi:plastocyanin
MTSNTRAPATQLMKPIGTWLAVLLALLTGAAGSGASMQGSRVTVTMTAAKCRASTTSVEPGPVLFVLVNRSGLARRFEIARRRSSLVRSRKRATLRVTFAKEGSYRYACKAPRRPKATRRGTLLVVRPVLEHRIRVRFVDGFGELYDRQTRQRFVPRGNNYIRIGRPPRPSESVHFTFNRGSYDAEATEAALRRMHAGGYNAVRVFVNAQCESTCAIDGSGRLSPAYVRNVTDFLRRAKLNGIFAILTGTFLFGDYGDIINAEPRTFVDNINLIYLTNGGIAAHSAFWRDFVRELIRQRAPLDAVLAYDLIGEATLVDDAKPFTLSSGLVTTPNGNTYDMAKPEDKQRMLDEGLVFWIDRVRAAVREVDRTGLVSESFFQPHGPNRSRVGDTRIVSTKGPIERSTADFIDLHPYPRVELTLPQYMENFGISQPTPKPVIMGEFGAFKFSFPSPQDAASVLQEWQRDSCAYGFDGWLLWTWDTNEQPELWNALSGDGVIEQALAPATRPDPCS